MDIEASLSHDRLTSLFFAGGLPPAASPSSIDVAALDAAGV